MSFVGKLVAYIGSPGEVCQRCSGDSIVVCECSACGTSVETHVTQCPNCGSVDIARYDI